MGRCPDREGACGYDWISLCLWSVYGQPYPLAQLSVWSSHDIHYS